MTAVAAAGIAAVVVIGTAVVLIQDPLRQVMALGIYGMAMTALFFAVQAPDVALSELVVSGAGLPLIMLAALRKLGAEQRRRAQHDRAAAAEETG